MASALGAYLYGRAPKAAVSTPAAADSSHEEVAKTSRAAAGRTVTIPNPPTPVEAVTLPHSPGLPLSLKDVPATPQLETAYRQLEKEYGPMYTTILDTSLARRAMLASCGIQATGAVVIEIRSAADPDTAGKTMTAHTVRIVKSSFTGKMAETVSECVHGAILHETGEAAIDGPNGVKMDPNEAVEFDFIDFPVEKDELYDFLRTGSLQSFHYAATKKTYGF